MNAPELYWIDHEASLGIAYSRCGAGDAGPDSPSYWHHAEGRWTAPWDESAHVLKLARPHAHDQSAQAAAVPMTVAVTPGAHALIYVLANDDTIASHLATASAVELLGYTTRSRIGLSL